MDLFSCAEHGWLWFSAFWTMALLYLAGWHFLAYARIFIRAVFSEAHFTLIGAFVAVVLTACLVWLLELQNPIGILGLAFFGERLAEIISCLLHERYGWKMQWRQECEVRAFWRARRLQRAAHSDCGTPYVKATVRGG